MLFALLLCAPLAVSQDVDLQMLLPGADPATRQAGFEAISNSGETRFLAPLLDLLSLAETAEEWYRILDRLSALTGEPMRDVERPWRTNSLRLADTPDRELPEGYLAFKRELYATRLSPEFRRFLSEEQAPIPHLDEIVFGGVAPGDLPALDHANSVSADEAAFLPDHAPVLGVALNGEARAYPHRILDWHELANDRLGGQSFALTWCTLCGAAIAYDATPILDSKGEDAPEPLVFDTSGLLLRSNKLMFDTATDSLWNQLTGEALTGPMARRGARLRLLPVVSTTFGRWKSEHPNTTVVTPETGHARDYTEGAAYGDYFASAETMFPTPRLGQNYAPKERIAVLRYAGESSSIPLADLEATGLVHVQLAGQRFVLLDQTPVVEAQLPAAWTEALLRSGATARRPSADALRQAASTSEVPLPPLDLETLLSLPRPARRSLLADPPESSLIAEQARPAAAVAHLVADVRAFEAGEHRFTRDPATGELLDESETRWEITSDQLTAPDSQPLPRIPSFLTFGFASDAAGMGEPQ